MRENFFRIVACLLLGIGAWLGGQLIAEPLPRVEAEPGTKQLLERIVRLEEQMKQLETRLSAGGPIDAIRTPLLSADQQEHDWRNRATGSRVVNGSRVDFLPLTNSRSE